VTFEGGRLMTAVLVADASQTVRMDLADSFEGAGFRVFTCATVAEARTLLRTQPIALAVIDPALSDGAGLELVSQIRHESLLSELPVLALARDIENVECIGKPYDRAYVIARARALVGAPPLRDSVLVIAAAAGVAADLVTAMSLAGFSTRIARTGIDGWRAALATRPSAILVDETPDVDRASVIRRLRLEHALRTTPCIGVGGAADEVPALEAGADAFVRSGDPELVLARLRALLRRAGTTNTEGMLPCVLAVDDDRDYLDLLASRLRKRGYDVVCAGSGERALELLATEQVDCIVLDRSMPGLGGVATCERIKGNSVTRDTPLIFVTSSEQREAVIESLAAGADDFVSKASGFAALVARVQAQLRRRHTEAEQREAREQQLRSELATLEARSARELAEGRAEIADHLAHANRQLVAINGELETFAYSVAHDLRAPLRAIGAFAHGLAIRSTDQLAVDHARRILAATTRMSELIDSLLELGRVQQIELGRHDVDLTAVAESVIDELVHGEPDRRVEHAVAHPLVATADGRLVRVLLDNLLGNAWRFTTAQPVAHIEIGVEQSGDERVFYVRDDGIGFDAAAVHRLFATGIGLQTARKIVERHGGRIWAEGSPGNGAKFSFTLPGMAP